MIWEDFLNSLWHDWRGSGASEDRLEHAAWRQRFWAKHGSDDAQAPEPSPAELSELRRLRDELRRLTFAIVDARRESLPLAASALEPLQAALRAAPFHLELELEASERPLGEVGFRLERRPLASDWQAVRCRVAAAYADMLAAGGAERLRVCDNPDCKWIYYDETKNRSKRYCDDKACGNLLKVRRFRERARQQPKN
ncbi:hypothetical protein B8V81_4473 [Paenibacillus pasadenensis]|uniref:Zinc finger CGNR domain-containing protein n=1 Tax=Paenibacillus pasadenensis TaxID=217090 RepID=A0A2N5N6S4_9BACL|nr:CGNR zinc finger domain-containing protein [Paenibacillus pasadenensis]PLT46042.1 hypothetical protein B8V81_4473 [Paenibacillus pasadenensis]